MKYDNLKIGDIFRYNLDERNFVIGKVLELSPSHHYHTGLLIYKILVKRLSGVSSSWNYRLPSVRRHEEIYGIGNVGRIWLYGKERYLEEIIVRLTEDEAMAWLI